MERKKIFVERNDNVFKYRFQFPTLQVLGEDLVSVLNFLHVKYVICLGEGAGANVCARFGLAHPSKVIGMILINCTGSPASVMDSFKNKVSYIFFILNKIIIPGPNFAHFQNLS